MSLERFRKQSSSKSDYFLILLVFILILFGLLMIYSSSVVISYELFGYNNYYLNKQFYSLLLGIVVWVTFSKLDYKIWLKYASSMLIITLGLLIAVFIPGIGEELGGAHRWISLGPIFFQPAEVCKMAFIIYLAAWLAKKGEGIKDFQTGFLPFLAVIVLVALLIIKQPDMGTMSIITAIAAVMFFVAGASWYHVAFGLSSLFGLFILLIKSAPYRLQRLMVFLNPGGSENLGASYHINQALLAIGSGGLLGLGFGQSKQKFFYLPEPHIDSIFAIIVEELGFLRASLIVLAFLLIAWRGYKIAKNAPDNFSKLLAIGITSWIVIQFIINVAAMLSLIPLTGVPLPFISYGGTSLVVLLAGVGILTNISKQTNSNQ